jgi:hypothetical protein
MAGTLVEPNSFSHRVHRGHREKQKENAAIDPRRDSLTFLSLPFFLSL